MLSDGASQVDPLYSDRFNHNILFFCGGTNDINQGKRTGAQVIADIQTYCAARKATGWQIVLVTIPNGNDNEDKAAVNTWLRANYATVADSLADVDAEEMIRPTSNEEYYTDGVHFTDIGYQIFANVVYAAFQSLP